MRSRLVFGVLLVFVLVLGLPFGVLGGGYGFVGPGLRFEFSAPSEVRVGSVFGVDLTFTVASFDLYNVTVEVAVRGGGVSSSLRVFDGVFLGAGNFTVVSLSLRAEREGVVSLGVIVSYDYFVDNGTNHVSNILWVDVARVVGKLRSELEGEISSLSGEVEYLKSVISDLNSSYRGLMAEYEGLKADYAGLEENLTSLRESYDALLDEYTALKAKLSAVEGSFSGVQQAMYAFMVATVVFVGCTGFLLALLLGRFRVFKK